MHCDHKDCAAGVHCVELLPMAEGCTSICSGVVSWNRTPGAEMVTSVTPANWDLNLPACWLLAGEPFCAQAGSSPAGKVRWSALS